MALQSEYINEAFFLMYCRQCDQLFHIIDRNLLRHVAKEISVITNRLALIGHKYKISSQIIRTLLKAICATQPNPNCLIPAHSHFLQACIDAQMYSFATNVINDTIILEIDTNNTSLSSLDYLKYFYYSGICFIGTGNMSEALDYFNQVITTPSSAISEIVVCTLKKARLLSLILTGRLYELPKLASSITTKFFKADMPLYDNIGKLYMNNDVIGLNLLLEENSDALHIDQNYGLAKQVIASINRNNLRKLTNTYITMSLNDINDRCVRPNNNSNDVNYSKNLLIEMISKNEISANIDEVTGLVKFGINKEEDNLKFLALLEQNMMETVSLSDKLRSMQKNILASPQYVSKNVAKVGSMGMDWEDDMHKAT